MKLILLQIKMLSHLIQKNHFKASGIRVGTPAMTTKGFTEEDFREVGKIIAYRLKNEETDEIKEECLKRVRALTDKVEMYHDIKYI